MLSWLREWYKTKVNEQRAKNQGFQTLFDSIEEYNHLTEGMTKQDSWVKMAEGRKPGEGQGKGFEAELAKHIGGKDVNEASMIVQDADQLAWLMTSRRPEYKGHVPGDQEAMIMNARRLYRFDPNARAAIRTVVQYIMGPGVKITPQSKDPQIHRLWREFWTSERNKMQLRQFEIPLRLFRDGELFMQFFGQDDDNKTSWKTTIRFRDPLLLRELPVTPSNGDYRTNSRLGVEVDPNDPETVVAYYISDPWDLAKVYRVEAARIIHIKAFADMDQKRGESGIQPVMEMFEHYRQWMKYRIILNKVRSAVVLVRKLTGGTGADVARMSQGLSQSATARTGENKKVSFREGTILNANAGVDYDFKTPNVNASDVTDDARRMKLEMAAGTGLPEYAFGDAANANMASTMISESPFVKEIKWWQTYLEYYFKEMFRRVIQQAVEAGKLTPPKMDDIFAETILKEGNEANTDQTDQDAKKMQGDKKGVEGSKDDLSAVTEYEAFYGCDLQWPEIVHREIDKTTNAMIAQVEAGLVSESTASSVLGYDYDEEVRKQALIEQEADNNPFKQNKMMDKQMDLELKKADLEAKQNELGAPDDKEKK